MKNEEVTINNSEKDKESNALGSNIAELDIEVAEIVKAFGV